jgi:hypothetical protein
MEHYQTYFVKFIGSHNIVQTLQEFETSNKDTIHKTLQFYKSKQPQHHFIFFALLVVVA